MHVACRYSYPCCGNVESRWAPIAATAASVSTLVIMNPGNGDSNQCPPNSDWVGVRDLMSSSGAKTLGYVALTPFLNGSVSDNMVQFCAHSLI